MKFVIYFSLSLLLGGSFVYANSEVASFESEIKASSFSAISISNLLASNASDKKAGESTVKVKKSKRSKKRKISNHEESAAATEGSNELNDEQSTPPYENGLGTESEAVTTLNSEVRATADAEEIAADDKSKNISVHYDTIFRKAREILKDESHKKGTRLSKKTSESAIVEYLQNHPNKINSAQAELLEVVRKESKAQKDQTKHLRLIPPEGMPGYSDLKFYVNHPFYSGSKVVPASNLINVWNAFLKQAQHKIMLNVFDFDLEQIASTLVTKAKSGVSVTVGIDAGTIKHRHEVAEIYEYLKKNKVNVVAVDSTKLNHQKMAVIDWSDSHTAKVLFSSGNLTQSCLGPEGDLKDVPANKRPKQSVPNANHVLTINSWLIANLIYNELTKTLNPEYHYRGNQYPVLGSYQITGPGVDPQTLEAYPENSVIISFSPGGGYRNINRNIIGHFIRASTGPIRMIQFAYSSKDVTEALVEKAQTQKEKFDFISVGDTPFAMQSWSQFLKMSGLQRLKNSKGQSEFVETESAFRDVLGKEGFMKLRKNIRIAPWYYSSAKVEVDGVKYAVNAKIHHKILAASPFAIVGTSFNFSDSAQKNNEQILVFKDQELVKDVDGMTRWLADQSSRSVFEEALRRNKYVSVPENVLPSADKVTVKEDQDASSDDSEDSTESRQAEP